MVRALACITPSMRFHRARLERASFWSLVACVTRHHSGQRGGGVAFGQHVNALFTAAREHNPGGTPDGIHVRLYRNTAAYMPSDAELYAGLRGSQGGGRQGCKCVQSRALWRRFRSHPNMGATEPFSSANPSASARFFRPGASIYEPRPPLGGVPKVSKNKLV